MTVTVTASPARGLDATLDLTERLAARGYRVVPHLSARLVADDAHLADIVARLLACGVDDVFVPAGDADPPAGQFHSALSLLTGSPRWAARSPGSGSPATRRATRGSTTTSPSRPCGTSGSTPPTSSATSASTRPCCAGGSPGSGPAGVTLPLYVGLAGPVERARLLRMAARAGVADPPGSWPGTPNGSCGSACPAATARSGCWTGPAAALTAPGAAVAGLHLFTFNQVRQTEEWRAALLPRLGGPDRGRLAI